MWFSIFSIISSSLVFLHCSSPVCQFLRMWPSFPPKKWHCKHCKKYFKISKRLQRFHPNYLEIFYLEIDQPFWFHRFMLKFVPQLRKSRPWNFLGFFLENSFIWVKNLFSLFKDCLFRTPNGLSLLLFLDKSFIRFRVFECLVWNIRPS